MRAGEEGQREALVLRGRGASRRLHHAVDGAAPPPVGPNLDEVSCVDDEGALLRRDRLPLAVELDLPNKEGDMWQ